MYFLLLTREKSLQIKIFKAISVLTLSNPLQRKCGIHLKLRW